jgi:formate-dependent nitrite reductase cytochrome c552 subunit
MKKTITVLFIIISAGVFLSFSFKNNIAGKKYADEYNVKDSVGSVKAFMEVYKVLMSPRCMNCHPSGDIPLQGDESKLHSMLPRRGKDGKGVYAMKCANCHQPTNIDGPGKPPGAPAWHLPPANMKMIFQGRTANQLAKQLVNPKTNGNKTLLQLKAHADDVLVKVGWNMGEGRTAPPMTYEAFKKAWINWIDKGAYAPKGK